MTDKELKKLGRPELLQLLMNQVQETEQLRAKVKELTEQVQRNEITCQSAGSLAEAALALNGVFQAADQAARKYIQEMADRSAKQEQELHAKADEARGQVKKLLAEAEQFAARVREEAEACLNNAKVQAEELLNQARADAQSCKAQAQAEEYRNKANAQIRALLESQATLKAQFETVGENYTV